jgi:hypothetical protein
VVEFEDDFGEEGVGVGEEGWCGADGELVVEEEGEELVFFGGLEGQGWEGEGCGEGLFDGEEGLRAALRLDLLLLDRQLDLLLPQLLYPPPHLPIPLLPDPPPPHQPPLLPLPLPLLPLDHHPAPLTAQKQHPRL